MTYVDYIWRTIVLVLDVSVSSAVGSHAVKPDEGWSNFCRHDGMHNVWPLIIPHLYLVFFLFCFHNTAVITRNLFKRLRKHGCTVDSMIEIPTSDLEKLLCPVGFYKVREPSTWCRLSAWAFALEKGCFHKEGGGGP